MKELREEIKEILKPYQLFNLATVNKNGAPWVRYVYAMGDDNLEIRFATCLQTRKVEHLKHTGKVHLTCGISGLEDMNKPFLQIQGDAHVDRTREAKHAFWNPLIANIYAGPDDPYYAVVTVNPRKIEYWKLSDPNPRILLL